MSVSFDWEFQDSEKSFSEEPGGSSLPPVWRSRLRRFVIVVVLICVAGLAIRAWADHRLQAVYEAEDELRDVVELELRDIRQGDAELFGLVQDPAVFDWRERQLARYIPGGDWGFAPAPGLVPAERQPDVEQVRVFGRNARVRLTYWFQPAPGASALFPQDLSSPWPFDVTWFYRQAEGGAWYHTAPPNDYPGALHSWHGTWLDVYAHRAESELLNDAIGDMFLSMYYACNLLNCPEDEHYELYFEDAPGPQIHGKRWTLPPLYLSGQPGDDASRSAWLHGVKLWLVGNLVQDLLGGEGVDGSLVYGYLAARVQAELGLLEPPSPDVEILEQAITQEQLHPLWSLWETSYDPDDLQKTRLQQAEVAALLQLLEAQVGPERFFQSLPELDEYTRLGDAVEYLYGLDRAEFMDDWYAHLASLTGVARSSILIPAPQVELPVSPTDLPLLGWPGATPGNQIALNCDGQILVGNMDGSRIAPLTFSGLRFSDPLWSPDGRWLLFVWQRLSGESEPLTILSADGSAFWFLGMDFEFQPLGWSHDGRRVYYYQSEAQGEQAQQGYWTMNIETRQSRLLPLWEPVFSPDGRRVVYFNLPYQDVGDPLWLADLNEQAAWGEEWENVRQLGRGAGTNVMEVSWSPDGERLALVLLGGRGNPDDYGISIYDLATERLTPLVSASELQDVVLSSTGDLLTGEIASTLLEAGGPLANLSIWGWSGDGRHLLVRTIHDSRVDEVTLLVPLDGSPPRVLAFGGPGLYNRVALSPTDPNRLAFIESFHGDSSLSGGYLVDLESGSVYSTTQVRSAAWSPDGEWLAFDGQDQLIVVDQEGQPRSVLNHDCGFAYPTWNPAADPSLPAAECRAGLDLWLDERDIYRVENTFVIVVHNSGDQAAQDVRLRFTSGGDEDVELPYHYINDSVEHVAPSCGGLLLRVAVDGDLSGPLMVSVNPPDEPDALPELDYENNQVTLSIP